MRYSGWGVIVLIGIAGTAGVAAYSAPADAAQAQIDIEVTTADTDAPARALVYGEGVQSVELELEYSGLGSGTHVLELLERDTLFDDHVRDITVEGDSGSETYLLSGEELTETNEPGEGRAVLFVRGGDEETSNSVSLNWQETTVYTKGYGELPAEVEPGEEITVEYYGWTNRDQTQVRLVEDDFPLQLSAGGNDETIRRESVSGPGRFEGAFTFVPSEYIEDPNDREIELQSRPADVNYYPDLVRNVTVAEPGPEIDAEITGFSPAAGEYQSGESVTSDVEVENTGDERHTFFVGYGVTDENGDTYDNDGTTGQQVTLSPGERDTVTLSWTVEEDAPPGSYSTTAAVWQESDPGELDTRLDEARVQDAFVVVEPPTTPPPTTTAPPPTATSPPPTTTALAPTTSPPPPTTTEIPTPTTSPPTAIAERQTTASAPPADETPMQTQTAPSTTTESTPPRADEGLVVTGLSADPAMGSPGEEVSIVATIENPTDTRVTEELRLVLYEEVVSVRTVTLDAGETREMEFTRQIESPGEYEAQVGDTAVTIVIQGAETTGTATASQTGPGFTVITALVAFAAVGLWSRRRR